MKTAATVTTPCGEAFSSIGGSGSTTAVGATGEPSLTPSPSPDKQRSSDADSSRRGRTDSTRSCEHSSSNDISINKSEQRATILQQDDTTGGNPAAASAATSCSVSFCPIGVVRSIYRLSVGTPRQGLLVPSGRGRIDFCFGDDGDGKVDDPKACVDGLDGYSHVWVVFVFHQNLKGSGSKRRTPHKISPPALGGSKKVGVLATRSPHRFNPIGLSLVKLDRIETGGTSRNLKSNGACLHISGLDLVDGTPVLDIKPYVPVYDAPPPTMPPAPTPMTVMVPVLPTTTTAAVAANEAPAFNGEDGIIHNAASSSTVKGGDCSIGNCLVPDWVSGGLQMRRDVVVSDDARKDLQRVLHGDNGENPAPLEFYSANEEDLILKCIVEVLAADVRSTWQTEKARKGKCRVEHSTYLLKTKTSAAAAAGGGPPAPAATTTTVKDSDESDGSDDGATKSCSNTTGTAATEEAATTQQIDNLLITYIVKTAQQTSRSASSGSGAEDSVLVTSIELLLG